MLSQATRELCRWTQIEATAAQRTILQTRWRPRPQGGTWAQARWKLSLMGTTATIIPGQGIEMGICVGALYELEGSSFLVCV
jgi:hypothetical protein